MEADKRISLEGQIRELLTRISSVNAEIQELKNQRQMLFKLNAIKKEHDKIRLVGKE